MQRDYLDGVQEIICNVHMVVILRKSDSHRSPTYRNTKKTIRIIDQFAVNVITRATVVLERQVWVTKNEQFMCSGGGAYKPLIVWTNCQTCLLYTSDAADE